MSEWDQIEARWIPAIEDVFEEFLSLYSHYAFGEPTDSHNTYVFIDVARKRYEQGREQHRNTESTWEAWSDDDYERNILEELMDAIIYAAARRIAQENAR